MTPPTPTTRRPLFDGVEQIHLTFEGHDTVVPLRYHSGTAMLGVFAARSRALTAKAPDPSLRPLTVAPGISPLVVIGFEFVTDIGAVNELCIAVPLRRSQLAIPLAPLAAGVLRGSVPTWIWHLPVSTEIANALGRQMWGFPKIHAEIQIAEDGDGSRTTRLAENGSPILSLHGPALDGSHTLRLPMLNHLWQDNAHVQTADHEFHLADVGVNLVPGTARLELLSDHPIARDVADVLISRRAIAYAHARSLQALLGMPKHLTPALLDRYRTAAETHDARRAQLSAA
jgi:Acetoacetate decarboxylase (ADC)